MAVNVSIQGTIISFPTSGESPNWSEPIVTFAQAVSAALASVTGPADVPPLTLALDPYNPASNISIPELSFSTTNVRAAFIRYAVYRQTSTNNAYEAGNLVIVYNPQGPSGSMWEMSRTYVGDGQISFSVSDIGQVSFSTTALAGLNHTGVLTYTAQAVLQSS